MSTAIAPFDPCGPLPTGVTLLEASAGTGKTHTIATLAVRYVAEGLLLDQLLVVTFTRMATGELRERVRERLVAADRALELSLAGIPCDDDPVLRMLASGDPPALGDRRGRVRRALADFDAATIATTHGFCQHVLEGLGTSGDVGRDAVFTEELVDLIGEVVDDLYVRRFHRQGSAPLSRGEAREVGRVAVANAMAPLEPRDAPSDSIPAMRVRLAHAVREELERRKRRMHLLTYDDLLTRLHDTLTDPERGEMACRRLRERYRVALIDEFQDTDPVQWEIVRRAFGEATLVLIGDPKQAVYAFRGADVHTYLRAAETATTQATLATSWRSDQGLIDAYDALFAGARLGHEGIAYRTVRAADPNTAPGLRGAPACAPLRVRVVRRADRLVGLTPTGYAASGSTREHIARDLAADVVRLLSSPAEVVRRGAPDGGWHPVRPGHLAVLVRTNRHAAMVRDALEAAGVPAVINGAGSVFATRAAEEWLWLLQAIERPASPTLAGSAALTSFLGWSAERLAARREEDMEELHAQLHRFGAVLRRRGVAALLEAITVGQRLPGRVLAGPGGERMMTDLRHVGQLLHEAASAGQLGVTALAAWLSDRLAEADEDTAHEDRSRRLESDAEAVQVLTIHRAKGLEFPIVYCPFLWEPGYIPRPHEAVPVFHDPAAGDERTIDVGGRDGPGFGERYRRFREEQRGEDLRLAYVALTRARHQAVVWWAGSQSSRDSALTRLRFSAGPDGTVATAGDRTPSDEEAWETFEALAAAAPGCVAVEPTADPDGRGWTPAAAAPPDLRAARFERPIDLAWRRSSYSSVTAGAEEERIGSEPEEGTLADEPAVGEQLTLALDRPAGDEERLRAVPLPLAETPAGPELGTLVHAVLERCDFADPALAPALSALVGEERERLGVAVGDPEALAAGLLAAIETPLGRGADGLRLRDLPRVDRLDELAFELPLAGGDRPAGELSLADVAALLGEWLGDDDPLAGYPARLLGAELATPLRGYLTGVIDLIARVRVRGGEERFAVIDYKSNLLGGAGPVSAWDYRPGALAAEMRLAHYPLQALFYAVALHRYLRWRRPGYDLERHLAGIGYLFLRGMIGPGTPEVAGQSCGVFWWRPAPGMVQALSDLLDRGAT